MRKIIWIVCLSALALPLHADDEASAATAQGEPVVFSLREIDVRVGNVNSDTLSSRFREYRDLPGGIAVPFARFAGHTGTLGYDVSARNVLQDDAYYRASLAPDSFEFTAEYRRIPHRFGNNGRTLFFETTPGNFAISDTLQQFHQDAITRQRGINPGSVNYAFLSNLVAPSLNATTGIDLGLLRQQGRAELKLTPDKPVDVRFTYFHEKRFGDRAVGTSFGFNNVVESPEPISYRTQDVGLAAEWVPAWGRVNAAFNYNWFTNNIPFHTFDNPWRITPTTDGSAYLGPSGSSINGPSFGRASLPPDNKAVTGTVGVAFKVANRSRLGASVGFGQWTQDKTPFIPYTSNPAVAIGALPATRLDGQIDTLSFNSYFTTRTAGGLSFQARYRRYDLDNKTPRIAFPAYVRFDGVFEDIPRISVPYGYTSDRLEATAAYTVDRVTFEGGWRYNKMDRTFRETDQTSQSLFVGKVDLRASDWAVLRASVEAGSTDYEGLHLDRSEHASFQDAEGVTNLLAVDPANPVYASLSCGGGPCNLRFDQAKKDVTRFGGSLVLTPAGTATVSASYQYGKDDYKETRYGLIEAKTQTFGLDVDYTPNERATLFAYYSYEKLSDFQRGRQSGGTLSTRTIDDWTSNVDDKINTFGAGGRFSLVPDKVDLNLNGSYQRVDGNNAIDSPPGGTPDNGVSIARFDDTRIWNLGAELGWKASSVLRLGFGGFYEKYELDDAQTTGLLFYLPGSFFLNPVDSDYAATVVYVKASYVF